MQEFIEEADVRSSRSAAPASGCGNVLRFGLLVLLAALGGAAAADGPTPEETVRAYLAAVQACDFAAAYPLVTAAMAQRKSRAEWVEEQEWVARVAELQILDFDVLAGRVEGDIARVPARLRSRDALASRLPVEEYELYTLRREDGRWKVDQQAILEGAALGEWVPAAPPTPAP